MLAEFSIYPMAGGCVGPDVGRLMAVLEASGLAYRLGPMGVCVEGDWDPVMAAIRRCREASAGGNGGAITIITVDDRKTLAGPPADEAGDPERDFDDPVPAADVGAAG